MASSASICSFTRIVPNSAAIRAPTRPHRTNAVTSVPNSSRIDCSANVPTMLTGRSGFSNW